MVSGRIRRELKLVGADRPFPVPRLGISDASETSPRSKDGQAARDHGTILYFRFAKWHVGQIAIPTTVDLAATTSSP